MQEPKSLIRYPEHPSQVSFPAFRTEGEKSPLVMPCISLARYLLAAGVVLVLAWLWSASRIAKENRKRTV